MFESDLLKKILIAPQSRESLQTFAWWGHKLALLTRATFKFQAILLLLV